MTKARGFKPDYAVRPGATILESYAYRLGISELQFIGLLHGKHPIDEDLAKALHEDIGPSPQFWMNLERNYRDTLKRLEAANR